MRGLIQPNHIPLSNYRLLLVGFIPLVFTEISGIEDELETTELPDRTRATGGNRGPTEFTAMAPMHHTALQAALEAWFRESQGPVSPTYKKTGTLQFISLEGSTARSFTVAGVFPMKRSTPDLDMSNEGEMAQVEWTFSVDDIIPI